MLLPALLLALSAAGAAGESPLARALSPYLRAHAAGPVGFEPWGEAAFARARSEDKPVFLLVGRAACHACRVRERGLLDDPEAVGRLARGFVPVLVDADERPDLAAAYAAALALGAEAPPAGSGWPLLALLTADGQPFFTALTRSDPAFAAGIKELLGRLAEGYAGERPRLEASAAAAVAKLREAQAGEAPRAGLGEDVLAHALRGLEESFDAARGGFGLGPKSPPHAALRLLLAERARTGDRRALRLATRTLDAMAASAVRDQVGGGFFRGSADDGWRLPRFEKTLADNALLLRAYARAQAETGSAVYRDVASGIVSWALGEMLDPAGGFHAALEGESDGVEGVYYLWSQPEILATLGPGPGARFLHSYRLDPPGVLSQAGDPAVGPAPTLAALLRSRSARTRPAADDRVSAGPNGLMIGALATSGTLLGRPGDLEAARGAAVRVLERLGPADALRHDALGSERGGPASLDDHADLAEGLLDLYEATRERRWREEAAALAEAALARFLDPLRGGFFVAGAPGDERPGPPPPLRLEEAYDGALPSGNGVMASVLLRLAKDTGEQRYARLGRQVVEAFLGDLERAPRGLETLAAAAGQALGPPAASPPEEPPEPARVVRGPVVLEGSLSSRRARPGSLVEARVDLFVSPPWCVPAHDPLAKGLVGLSLSAPDTGLAPGRPRYPEATAVRGGFAREIAAVHCGQAGVVVPLRVPEGTPPGEHRVRLLVRFQACAGRDCRKPEGVVLELPLGVDAGRP